MQILQINCTGNSISYMSDCGGSNHENNIISWINYGIVY